MYRYVVTAPGQGSQRPGMLDPWLDRISEATGLVSNWSELTGVDLIEASRDNTMLADTAVAQPLIVAASLLAYRLLRRKVSLPARELVFAGHSVGELAAASAAGYLSPEDAVRLAGVRGAAMSAACARKDTAMAAVMPARQAGLPDEGIVKAILGADLTVANWNGGHQFVAAGPTDRVKSLAAAPPVGTMVIPLAVAGAFHTDAMRSAVGEFATAIQETVVKPPTSAMVGNRDGALLAGPDDLRERLIAQITGPVRWDLCTEALLQRAPAAMYLELPPAGSLTRLLKRVQPGSPAFALRMPEDIDRVLREVTGSRRLSGSVSAGEIMGGING